MGGVFGCRFGDEEKIELVCAHKRDVMVGEACSKYPCVYLRNSERTGMEKAYGVL